MSDQLRIEIPGPPIPLQRARASKNRFYDPQYVAKENIRTFTKTLISPFKLLSGPVSLEAIFYIQIPKSWSKKKKAAHDKQFCAKKIDLSNILKFFEDTYNGLIWEDDCLICHINADKIWSFEPKTILIIKEL